MLFTAAVRVGFVDSRFIVTESVDSSITVCAELQEGFLERNITLMVVNVDSNGEIIIIVIVVHYATHTELLKSIY